MTIFKEADLKTALPQVKKKVKSLVKKGYAKAKGTVTPKWIVSQIAKNTPLGRVWKRIPNKQKNQITKLLSRGYEAAKGATKKTNGLQKYLTDKGLLKKAKQYGGSIRKAKY